jgi:hypothetical protein
VLSNPKTPDPIDKARAIMQPMCMAHSWNPARGRTVSCSAAVGFNSSAEPAVLLSFELAANQLQCAVCRRRFAKGEESELSEAMKEAQMEVERRLTDPLREYIWWLTAVSLIKVRCRV